MAADFHRGVSIAARRNRNRDDARAIRCRDVEPTMNPMAVVVVIERETNAVSMSKYLIIAGLLSIIFVLVYSRVRPYLQLIQKVINSLSVATDISASTAPRQKSVSENKLVRCERCGTWIPAERALRLGSGLATFCSPECLAKPASKERRIAG